MAVFPPRKPPPCAYWLRLRTRAIALGLLAVAIVAIGLGWAQPARAFQRLQFYDGNHMVLLQGGIKTKIRLACMEAPKLDAPGGIAARDALSQLVDIDLLRLRALNRDRYGRVLAEVYVGRTNVNLALVERGLAYAARDRGRDCAGYELAEAQAREARRGLWADPPG